VVAGAHTFGYDELQRLTSATHPNQPAESYSYDPVGNRTTSHQSTSYTYAPVNRVTQIGSTTYTYDFELILRVFRVGDRIINSDGVAHRSVFFRQQATGDANKRHASSC